MVRLSYANVMSTLAFFLAVAGGTAVAATTLPRNSVTSATVKDNSLTSQDLRNGKAVRRTDVDATQVQLRVGQGCPEGQAIRVIDIKGGVACEVDDRGGSGGGKPSGPAGGDLAGSYPNPTVRNGAINSLKVADSTLTGDDIRDSMLTGDDIGNNTLTGDDIDEVTLGRVPSALLGGLGRSGATTVCDPADATFVPCAATEIINVPPGARALVFGRLEANYTSAAGFGWGECRLSASSIGVVPNTQQSLTVGSGDQGEHATLVGVTPPLSAGPTAFGIACNQRQGNITFSEISASVVLISGA